MEPGRRAEKAWHESTRGSVNLYQLLFEANPQPMWLFDPETLRFLDVNQAAIEKYGYTRQEFLNMTIAEIRPSEDVDHLLKTVNTRKGAQFTGEWHHHLKDGRIIEVEVSTQTLESDGKKAILVVVNDISARRRVENEALTSLRRYQHVLDSMLEGCQIIDYEWHYIYINNAAARHGHSKPEELLMRTMMEVYPGIENTELFKVLKRCMAERVPEKMDNEFVYPDGSKGWFELSIEPVPEGLSILSIDITERKLAKDKVSEHLEQLMALREIDQSILGSLSLSLTLDLILSIVARQLNVDATDILLIDRNSRMLEHAAGHGFHSSAESQKVKLRIGEGFAGEIALLRKHVHVQNLAYKAEKFTRKSLAKVEGFVSYFGEPLIAKGKVIGVLEAFHRTQLNPDADWLSFLETLAGQTAIAVDSAMLFEDLQRSNSNLILAYETTLEGWSQALDLRDKETEGHTQRVTAMTLRLAEEMGVSELDLISVRRGALLHDIGKMGVPDHILLKPDKLTEDEWEKMRMHPVYAYDMLSKIAYLHQALEIPYCHHEKWDGTGYPRGLKGEQIPFAARIFAVVDVYDAITSDRPYRAAWPKDKALDYIREQSGTHFDPQAVQAFMRMMQFQ